MIHVVCVHTAMALVEPLTAIFKEYLPEVTVNHIADSSLIKEVIANNQVTPAVRRRLLSYYNAAADAGADVVFNTCSSVGDIADYGTKFICVFLTMRTCFFVPLQRNGELKSNVYGRK